MDKLLKSLYDNYYTPLAQPELDQEIEECHQKLIEVLGKPERKLVLQIIDAQDEIAELLSIDSFIAGFSLACRLSDELNHHQTLHPILTRDSVRPDAISLSEDKEQPKQ